MTLGGVRVAAGLYTPLLIGTEISSTHATFGALAGLATSFLWACTSVLFTEAGSRIGPTRVNLFRLVVALVLHAVTWAILMGTPWPMLAWSQLILLALSGLIGFSICDQAMLVAMLDIGPRRALLIMTTAPIFALGFGWAALGESPGVWSLLGVALTLAGVVWVTLGRQGSATGPAWTAVDRSRLRRGVGLAVFAAACQAAGFMLSKKGMGHGVADAIPLEPQGATLVRVFFGMLGVLPILIWNARGRGLERPRDARRGYTLAAAGACTGPFLGVWCSLIAVDRVPVGVAQTLCGLAPVVILPLAWAVWREHVSPRAIVGALIAVGGSTLLVLTAR